MKYVKFLSLPLAVFLTACFDPVPQCGDAEVVSVLKDLQKQDVQQFWKDAQRKGTLAWQHLYWRVIGEEMNKEIAKIAKKSEFKDFVDEQNKEDEEWTIEEGKVEKPLKYSEFFTEERGTTGKIKQCSAVANGEIAVGNGKKIVFKNFHASYELKVLDNNDFYVTLFTGLIPAPE